MKTLGICALLVGFVAMPHAIAESASRNLYKEHTQLSRSDFLAIERAIPVVRRERPTWSEYQISVIETNDSLLVSFWRKVDEFEIKIVRLHADGSPPDAIGGIPRVRDSVVVTLDKHSLKITGITHAAN